MAHKHTSTMPRAPVCAFGVAFELMMLAIWAAANVAYVRWSSSQWGLNPINNTTLFCPTLRTRHAIGIDACSEQRHVGGRLRRRVHTNNVTVTTVNGTDPNVSSSIAGGIGDRWVEAGRKQGGSKTSSKCTATTSTTPLNVAGSATSEVGNCPTSSCAPWWCEQKQTCVYRRGNYGPSAGDML